jgi:hypothetical protein
VNLVGEPEEPVVLARIAQVEDIVREDANFADTRAGGLELGEARQALRCAGRLLCGSPPGCPGQGRKANEQAVLN